MFSSCFPSSQIFVTLWYPSSVIIIRHRWRLLIGCWIHFKFMTFESFLYYRFKTCFACIILAKTKCHQKLGSPQLVDVLKEKYLKIELNVFLNQWKLLELFVVSYTTALLYLSQINISPAIAALVLTLNSFQIYYFFKKQASCIN